MQEGAEACGKAEILIKVTCGRGKCNAGRGRSLRQCRNPAKRDVQAGEMQCRREEKFPAMQKSCSKGRKGGENSMQRVLEAAGNADILLKTTFK